MSAAGGSIPGTEPEPEPGSDSASESASDEAPSAFPGFDSMAEDTGELIQQLIVVRRRQGLSQTEVAARMGTSQSALACFESGRSDARLSTVVRYAEAVEADLGFALRAQDGSS